jgi:hypothetical protein
MSGSTSTPSFPPGETLSLVQALIPWPRLDGNNVEAWSDQYVRAHHSAARTPTDQLYPENYRHWINQHRKRITVEADRRQRITLMASVLLARANGDSFLQVGKAHKMRTDRVTALCEEALANPLAYTLFVFEAAFTERPAPRPPHVAKRPVQPRTRTGPPKRKPQDVEVRARPGGGWGVGRANGTKRPTFIFTDKAEAVGAGQAMARRARMRATVFDLSGAVEVVHDYSVTPPESG